MKVSPAFRVREGAATTNVLLVCARNSVSSVMAEGLLNQWAVTFGKSVRAYSAGSTPSGVVDPVALRVLTEAGIATGNLSSKSWHVFASPTSPRIRAVISVGDQIAFETAPAWPGGPATAHWPIADPVVAPVRRRLAAYEQTRLAIGYRLLQLLALPLDGMNDKALQSALQAIART